jgi:hypothetical protein
MKRVVIVALFSVILAGCDQGSPIMPTPSGIGASVERSTKNHVVSPDVEIVGKSVDFDSEGNIIITQPSRIGSYFGWVADIKVEGNKIIIIKSPKDYLNINVLRYNLPDEAPVGQK